jgi:hypothetical protein
MDQNDPQQRTAEPEAYNDSHKSGRAWDFTNLWNGLVMAFLVVTLGICAVTYGALTLRILGRHADEGGSRSL